MFKKKSLTASSLGIRVIMGGYLLYLSYTLIPSISESVNRKEMIFWCGMIALFFGVGVTIIFFSAKAFIKGDYDKGIKSEETEMENEEEDRLEEEDRIEEEGILKSDEVAEDVNLSEEDKNSKEEK